MTSNKVTIEKVNVEPTANESEHRRTLDLGPQGFLRRVQCPQKCIVEGFFRKKPISRTLLPSAFTKQRSLEVYLEMFGDISRLSNGALRHIKGQAKVKGRTMITPSATKVHILCLCHHVDFQETACAAVSTYPLVAAVNAVIRSVDGSCLIKRLPFTNDGVLVLFFKDLLYWFRGLYPSQLHSNPAAVTEVCLERHIHR